MHENHTHKTRIIIAFAHRTDGQRETERGGEEEKGYGKRDTQTENKQKRHRGKNSVHCVFNKKVNNMTL